MSGSGDIANVESKLDRHFRLLRLLNCDVNRTADEQGQFGNRGPEPAEFENQSCDVVLLQGFLKCCARPEWQFRRSGPPSSAAMFGQDWPWSRRVY